MVLEPGVEMQETRHLLHLVVPVQGLGDETALLLVGFVDSLETIATEITARRRAVPLPGLLAHPTEVELALNETK